MGNSNIEIVCYMGGVCGDLVMSVIDSRDSVITDAHVMMPASRYKLKKPHLFQSSVEKDQYLIDIAASYKSIPSHDTEYHVERGHSFITSVITDVETALWAAARFKNYHRPQVWDEMLEKCGANSISDYADQLMRYSDRIQKHTTKVVNLNDIRSGNLLDKLQQFVSTPLD